MKIKQKGYGNIEIDNTEIDIVQIWMHELNPKTDKIESNVIQVRRENVASLINILNTTLKNGPTE